MDGLNRKRCIRNPILIESTIYINLDDIAPIVIPENPPWLIPKPTFNFELTQFQKSETNPLLIQQHFAEIRSAISEYSAIYTDGQRMVIEWHRQLFSDSRSIVFDYHLPVRSSVQKLILPALKFVASSDKNNFMICSDSLSCLLAIESCKTQSPFIQKKLQFIKACSIGKHVIFT